MPLPSSFLGLWLRPVRFVLTGASRVGEVLGAFEEEGPKNDEEGVLPETLCSELGFDKRPGRWGIGGGRARSGYLTAGMEPPAIKPFSLLPDSSESLGVGIIGEDLEMTFGLLALPFPVPSFSSLSSFRDFSNASSRSTRSLH